MKFLWIVSVILSIVRKTILFTNFRNYLNFFPKRNLKRRLWKIVHYENCISSFRKVEIDKNEIKKIISKSSSNNVLNVSFPELFDVNWIILFSLNIVISENFIKSNAIHCIYYHHNNLQLMNKAKKMQSYYGFHDSNRKSFIQWTLALQKIVADEYKVWYVDFLSQTL